MEQAPKTEDTPVSSAATSARDWSELPLDAVVSVFGKLGAIEILMGAGLVCRPWLQAAKMPELWRSVDMARHKVVLIRKDQYFGFFMEPKIKDDALCAMAKVAVDRSGGQLQAFFAKRFVTDELLNYIGDRSPALKGIALISCDGVSNKGFTELITKCPQMEEVVLMLCRNVGGRDVYESAGKACAQLKRFWLRKSRTAMSFFPDLQHAGEALGVAAMHELRCLTLFGSNVTNDELGAILEGCPHLVYLDLRGCFNLIPDDDALRTRCARIKSLMLPSAREIEEYEYKMFELSRVDASDREFDYGSD